MRSEIFGGSRLTKVALEDYKRRLEEQHSRNEARLIRTKVNDARGSVQAAGRRWPFELFQNALDAGPRLGTDSVAIRLSSAQDKVAFEHDGLPFTSNDLAALLSGGSSKDFESKDTTGRFGTGFLVTHVLARQTTIQGLLETPEGYEQFNLTLDRGGDEDAILKNMLDCDKAILSAERVSNLTNLASATFNYQIDDDNPLALGIESLKKSMPYLYATRQILGCVELNYEDKSKDAWIPAEIIVREFEGGYVEYRSINSMRNGTLYSNLRIFRFRTSKQALASVLVLVKRTCDGWKIVLPEEDAPRIYREYPLRGSGFLPVNFILDGKFEPDQERSRLLMSDQDKDMVEDAFDAAVLAVKYAFKNQWRDAHLLTKVCKPASSFEVTDDGEREWWSEQLASFADRVARLPIVECTSGMLPAIGSDVPYADFIVPSLSEDSRNDETTVERMWPLVEDVTDLLPPKEELARIWSEIATGWHSLDVQVNRIGVKSLAEWARNGAQSLGKLRVNGDAEKWLALFLDIVGECWKARSGVDLTVLDGIMPNQNRILLSPLDLLRDEGIPEVLKDICRDMALDVRERLILGEIQKASTDDTLPNLEYALEKAISNVATKEDVLKQAIEYLRAQLPEDERFDVIPIDVQHGSVRLLRYIWESRGVDGASLARQIPLITISKHARRWSQTRMMMAPVSNWHESAQQFANAYPPNRVLDDVYIGSSSAGIPNCVNPLVAWGIAIADPITVTTPTELTPQRLTELSKKDVTDITVSNNTEDFSQIALLQPEMINRCREGIEEARALLGLVLRYVAPNDPRWGTQQIVKGRKAGKDIEVTVNGAMWLADLKVRPWVPVIGEDGKPVPMPAKVETIHNFLDPSWLKDNNDAIALLSNEFGFDQLELRLLGIETNDSKRVQLRDGLASLVELGGADPKFYARLTDLAGSAGSDPDVYSSLTDLAKLHKSGKVDLVELVEKEKRQSRDVEQFRRLGFSVQEAIELALTNRGLSLELVDRGFDYKVTGQTDDVLGDASMKIVIGPYLLEVKATTTGDVRMTPKQAETASEKAKRYVLCVVDLRSMKNGQLPDIWSASMVEPLAKIVTDIGHRIKGTYSLVETARKSEIAVRNEAALRYQVPSTVWETGITIDKWVSTIKANNASQVATP